MMGTPFIFYSQSFFNIEVFYNRYVFVCYLYAAFLKWTIKKMSTKILIVVVFNQWGHFHLFPFIYFGISYNEDNYFL